MRSHRSYLIGAGIALVCLTAGAAFAQSPADNRTFFTFSGPVAVPGVTLPAGKYMFRLADTGSRNIVQVLSADGKTPYAAFFFHRLDRSVAARDPEVRFMETAADMPKAVRTWWYPGERGGYEFVYPKAQALLLAKGTGTPVLTAASASKPEALETVAPSGKETPLAQNAPAPAEGAALKGEVASSEIPVAEPTQQARAELPRTASHLPFIGLLGLGLFLGAGLVRGWRLG